MMNGRNLVQSVPRVTAPIVIICCAIVISLSSFYDLSGFFSISSGRSSFFLKMVRESRMAIIEGMMKLSLPKITRHSVVSPVPAVRGGGLGVS